MAQVKPNNFHLIPCPFDGKKGDSLGILCRNGGIQFNYNESDEDWACPKHDATVNVICLGCHTEGPTADNTVIFNKENVMTPADWDALRSRAVDLWNKRAFIAHGNISEIREILNNPTENIYAQAGRYYPSHPGYFKHRAKIGTGPSTKVWTHPDDLLMVGARIRFRDIQDGKDGYRGDEWDTGILNKYIDTDMLMIERM